MGTRTKDKKSKGGDMDRSNQTNYNIDLFTDSALGPRSSSTLSVMLPCFSRTSIVLLLTRMRCLCAQKVKGRDHTTLPVCISQGATCFAACPRQSIVNLPQRRRPHLSLVHHVPFIPNVIPFSSCQCFLYDDLLLISQVFSLP